MDDQEIEMLEALRRHGISDVYDDGTGSGSDGYYALPPLKNEMLKDWLEWRKNINGMMSDVSVKYKDTYCFEPEREILTSPNSSKTPEFFNGQMSIHGQRVKDQYGGKPIVEEDDTKTKLEKKVIEGNFYLFGIPRISIRRSSLDNEEIQTSFGSARKTLLPDGRPVIRRQTFSHNTRTLQNTEELKDLDRRPFKGLALARKRSMSVSRIGSNASLALSRSLSSNDTQSSVHDHRRLCLEAFSRKFQRPSISTEDSFKPTVGVNDNKNKNGGKRHVAVFEKAVKRTVITVNVKNNNRTRYDDTSEEDSRHINSVRL